MCDQYDEISESEPRVWLFSKKNCRGDKIDLPAGNYNLPTIAYRPPGGGQMHVRSFPKITGLVVPPTLKASLTDGQIIGRANVQAMKKYSGDFNPGKYPKLDRKQYGIGPGDAESVKITSSIKWPTFLANCCTNVGTPKDCRQFWGTTDKKKNCDSVMKSHCAGTTRRFGQPDQYNIMKPECKEWCKRPENLGKCDESITKFCTASEANGKLPECGCLQLNIKPEYRLPRPDCWSSACTDPRAFKLATQDGDCKGQTYINCSQYFKLSKEAQQNVIDHVTMDQTCSAGPKPPAPPAPPTPAPPLPDGLSPFNIMMLLLFTFILIIIAAAIYRIIRPRRQT